MTEYSISGGLSMRYFLIIAVLFCSVIVDAADVNGVIKFAGIPNKQISVGYVALTDSGSRISNMAGLTPTGTSGKVWCDTYKPRRTSLTWHSKSGLSFQHTNLPAGKYLFYARYADNYLSWRIINLTGTPKNIQTVLSIDSLNTGELKFQISKGIGDYNIKLVPITDKFKLPIAGVDFGDMVSVDVDFKSKSTTVNGLKPGNYMVMLRSAKREGTPKTGMLSVYTDIGMWSATVKRGQSITCRIP
jgi:hypothetical protein